MDCGTITTKPESSSEKGFVAGAISQIGEPSQHYLVAERMRVMSSLFGELHL